MKNVVAKPSTCVSKTMPVGRRVRDERVSSEQLFAGASVVEIEHQGVVYYLRKTSLGKLILTK
jgi:hemin uptake protein HemP